jgi:hypothetical protein
MDDPPQKIFRDPTRDQLGDREPKIKNARILVLHERRLGRWFSQKKSASPPP